MRRSLIHAGAAERRLDARHRVRCRHAPHARLGTLQLPCVSAQRPHPGHPAEAEPRRRRELQVRVEKVPRPAGHTSALQNKPTALQSEPDGRKSCPSLIAKQWAFLWQGV